MLVMPERWATAGCSSTLSLPTVRRPAYWVAISSTTGPTRRHGPHQGAQKSISTGPGAWRTSCSKLLVVIVVGVTIYVSFHVWVARRAPWQAAGRRASAARPARDRQRTVS